MEILIKILMAHCFGDYVLQTAYIAEGKQTNPWLLFVHCVLYAVPFLLLFRNYNIIAVLILTHVIVDTLKVKKKISYTVDQILHLVIAFGLCYVDGRYFV